MPITVPTVLVLGAGASQPYGFPVGFELRDAVCEQMADWRYRRVVEASFGVSSARTKEFGQVLQHSGFVSVDAFLEAEPTYAAVGKLAIALALVPLERHARLFPPAAPRNGHWYEYLLNVMEPGTPNWTRNRLTILTFNYDRSLEHYFCTVLGQRLNGGPTAGARAFKRIEVLHLHGQLGSYPGLGPRAVSYGDLTITREAIQRAANSIRTISEQQDLRPFAKAGKRLMAAKRIFFLGFGYADTTMQRLQHHAPECTAYVRGTSKGMSDRDWARITRSYFAGQWVGKRSRRTVLDFLRSDVDLRFNPDPSVPA